MFTLGAFDGNLSEYSARMAVIFKKKKKNKQKKGGGDILLTKKKNQGIITKKNTPSGTPLPSPQNVFPCSI